jgi:hypothetical protein
MFNLIHITKMAKKIKTFEDALKVTGRANVPEFLELPEDLREYFKAQYKAIVITEALNEGWKADWEDENQIKYFPWFSQSASGLVFDVADCYCSSACAGGAYRLCFKTAALAEYAGKTFIDIYEVIIKK